MMVAKDKAKQWVEKTKIMLEQAEREKKVFKKFKEIFDMEPEEIIWEDQSCIARTKIGPDGLNEYVEGNKVWEVIFKVFEAREMDESDDMWCFEKEEKDLVILYRWTTRNCEVIIKVIK